MRPPAGSRRQWLFAAYIFLPAAVAFFLPIAFFRIPMVAWLWDGRTFVSTPQVWMATGVSAVWLGLAAGIVVWPARSRAAAKPWTLSAEWMAFLTFSLLGIPTAMVNAWCGLPAWLAATAYWSSFAPVLGFLGGMGLVTSPVPRRQRVLLWVLMGLDLAAVVLGPISLSKVNPAGLSIIAILYGLHAGVWRRRAWLVMLALLVPLLFVSIPAKEFLREAMYEGDAFRKNATGCVFPYRFPSWNLRATRDLYLQRSTHLALEAEGFRRYVARIAERAPLAGYALSRGMIRINRLSDLAYVILKTPDEVAFADGTTYRPLLSKILPRLLWPGKPADDAGQFYGHRYGFLAPGDTVHSMNLTMIVEAWMNGGWIYVVLSAIFLGLVLRAIWIYLVGDSRAMGNVAVGTMVVAAAAHQESNLSAVVGGILQAIVIYLAAESVIRHVGEFIGSRLQRPVVQGPQVTEAADSPP